MFEEKLRTGHARNDVLTPPRSRWTSALAAPERRRPEASVRGRERASGDSERTPGGLPGGVQFSGPDDPAATVELDGKWEGGGSPTRFGVVCASDATSAADALARGEQPSLVLQGRGEFSDAVFKRLLAPPSCPWVLVTSQRRG